MKLGLFMMPAHHPGKDWRQSLEEDRQAVIDAEHLGFSEVWVGEHFSTKVEQIPSPLMFFASLVERTSTIRFGTGVVNLPHHHPVIVAAEAAMLDQLSGGRLMLGIGPGGLMADGELFGREDMAERYGVAMDSLDAILALWQARAPFRIEGAHFQIALEKEVWPHCGIGEMCRPLQRPHPPIAMAMVGPGGRTAETIAERDFIPISANFVPVDVVEQQWLSYAAARERLGKPADPAIWRLCRNILVTGSRSQAEDALADPEGTLAYYFRYLRGLRRLADVQALGPDATGPQLNALLDIGEALTDCVIAGTTEDVLERLVALVDRVGPFGQLVMVGHDWEASGLWQGSMRRLAAEVMPRLARHAKTAHRAQS